MNLVIGYFGDEGALLRAVRAARAADVTIADAYTPYAVHGLDDAMGVKRSRLTWVCFAAGLTGGTLAMTFQLWTSAVSWPVNVGGKPFASVPAFLPVTFELTVLFAALISVTAFLFRSRLFPGQRAQVLPRVTDDRFALVLTDGDQARQVLKACGVDEMVAAPVPNEGAPTP